MVQQFNVVGMSCGHCVRAVTEAVHGLDQTAVVQIDLPTGTVTVQSDAATARIEATIVNAGYEVKATAA
jgi:copper chaperone